jgi:hypothetical protein
MVGKLRARSTRTWIVPLLLASSAGVAATSVGASFVSFPLAMLDQVDCCSVGAVGVVFFQLLVDQQTDFGSSAWHWVWPYSVVSRTHTVAFEENGSINFKDARMQTKK